MADLTVEQLKKYVTYNAETGLFTARIKSGKRKAGSVLGTVGAGGYIFITILGKHRRAHRMAWLYVYGVMPEQSIDHVNHIPSDNRIENLRDVSHKSNLTNCRSGKNNTSGMTGVQFNKENNNWRARITINGTGINLGSFTDFNKAVVARKEAERLYGFHENHGEGDYYR